MSYLSGSLSVMIQCFVNVTCPNSPVINVYTHLLDENFNVSFGIGASHWIESLETCQHVVEWQIPQSYGAGKQAGLDLWCLYIYIYML